MKAKLDLIARRFVGGAATLDIAPLGNGLINDTFAVSADSQPLLVLQRLNSHVFPQPEWVMDNLLRLNRHLAGKPAADVQLKIPAPIPTLDGEPFYRDGEGRLWRALEWISPSESRSHIGRDAEAAQIGFALGHFHSLCSDLTPAQLHDTLPGFHIAPVYFQAYLEILQRPLTVDRDADFEFCTDFVAANSAEIGVLENAKANGDLTERVIHGDPKLNNFLFEPGSARIVSLIDLDTVKPGLPHYDIGDCLRSCCRTADRRFDLRLACIILESYLQQAGNFFTAADYDYLIPAIWLIPFELGLRFFSDYLTGDRYFKTSHPRQNLERAMAQFQLCRSIASQRGELSAFVAGIRAR